MQFDQFKGARTGFNLERLTITAEELLDCAFCGRTHKCQTKLNAIPHDLDWDLILTIWVRHHRICLLCAIKLWLKGPIKPPTEERERVCLEFLSLLRIFWVDLINFCCIPPTCLACNSKLWQNYNRVTLYKSTVPWHFLRNGRNQLFNYNKWNSMITGKRYIGREKLIAAALAGSQPASQHPELLQITTRGQVAQPLTRLSSSS